MRILYINNTIVVKTEREREMSERFFFIIFAYVYTIIQCNGLITFETHYIGIRVYRLHILPVVFSLRIIVLINPNPT